MTISERIKERRKAIGITQEQLAVKVGVSQNAIHKLEDGTTKKPRNILDIAKALQCAPDWLLYGGNPAFYEKSKAGNFPLVSWVQATSWNERKKIEDIDVISDYACPVDSSPDTFVLRMYGSGVKPIFFPNDLIFVDPKAELKNGKYVIAHLESDLLASLKQLVIDGNDMFVTSISSRENQLIPIKDSEVIGVVVASTRFF